MSSQKQETQQQKKERLAKALRANLKRRKAQERSRKSDASDDREGNPPSGATDSAP